MSRELPSAESQQIFRPGLFQDQVAIVTGGGSGIGLATAAELCRLGANVVIAGRTEKKLEAAIAELASIRGESSVVMQQCDIREPGQVADLVDAALDSFGAIDMLVNNAGGQFPSPAENISPNGFAAVVRNNLNGTFNVTREVATRSMIPQKTGRIVNVIANIYRGFPGMVHTGAARAGVENMTMTLAVEWARFGITINAVAPGVIRSSGMKQYPPALIEHAERSCPLGRLGTVEEVAASLLFLLSPGAQYVTGTTIRIDGAHSLAGDLWQTFKP